MKSNNQLLNVITRKLGVKFLTGSLVFLLAYFPLWSQSDEGRSIIYEPLWEYSMGGFEKSHYDQAVSTMINDWEERTGKTIQPGEQGKVGLKIYTSAGPGLGTPRNLVLALIDVLLERGYEPSDIFLLDTNSEWMRSCGYLPPLSQGGKTFNGYEVKVLNSGDFYNPTWFYDSPVPPMAHFLPGITPMVQSLIEQDHDQQTKVDDRKSFIPAPLITDVDFWINLPVISDHPVLGLNGALVNATLWNASNTLRFFNSPANAPVAIAEMAAIPEFLDKWAMTFVSLEHFQFIGGPQFNSLYTVSQKLLIMSSDPVAVDNYMVNKINLERRPFRFPDIPENFPMLVYAEQLGIGYRSQDPSRIIRF